MFRGLVSVLELSICILLSLYHCPSYILIILPLPAVSGDVVCLIVKSYFTGIFRHMVSLLSHATFKVNEAKKNDETPSNITRA